MTLPVEFFESSFFRGRDEMSGVFLSSIGDATANATMVNKINCKETKLSSKKHSKNYFQNSQLSS